MMQPGIFEEHDKWTRYLVLSAGLHLLLVVAAVIGGYFSGPRGQNWGGPSSGESVQASLVSAVPLPSTRPSTDNIVATDNKGLTQSVPQTAVEKPDAIPIPENETKRKPQKPAVTQQPDIHRPVTPPADNTVPYGQGGALNVSGAFTAGNVQAGFHFDGEFGVQFAYYVSVIKAKVSAEWHPGEIGPGAQGHRAFVSFDISRDGTPGNVKLETSSNVPALDISATRALQRIDTFGKLPDGYKGSYLHVELTFEPPR